MPKKTQPQEDDWHGVQDARARKKIQDRLAQRARRQRLASKLTSATQHAGPKSGVASHRKCSSASSSAPSLNSSSRSSLAEPNPERSLACMNIIPIPPTQSIFSALFSHGLLLNIACGTTSVHISPPPPPSLPSSLHPLPIQRSMMHFQFIDRFPVRLLRHNMVLHQERFSAEAYLADIFGSEMWRLEEGVPTWEERAWVPVGEMCGGGRWAFLLEEEGRMEDGWVEDVPAHLEVVEPHSCSPSILSASSSSIT